MPPVSTLPPTLRSAVLGTATGLRSQMGAAAVILGPESHRVPSVLRTRAFKTVTAVLAGGELLYDKLPQAANRTQGSGLAARVALGAGSAGLLARSEQEPPGPAALVGAGTAVGGAFAGMVARRWLSKKFPPLAVALGEDAVAVGLAAAAVTVLADRR